ncbi:ImpB/MucB/SamB family protein [Streptococcus sp. DD11]|nr:ImpB/MucB/SamB family protein [Streptococcus sp. DD11]
MGLQLWFHAHGIDESNVHHPYQAKSQGLGNSQILPCDYRQQADIELVFKEMAEQVAVRLRRAGKKTQRVAIHARYSKLENRASIHTQRKIEACNNSDRLAQTVTQLFRSKYQGGAIRQIGVYYSDLVDQSFSLISLFDDPLQQQKEEELQLTIDRIRDQFGFTSLLKGSALLQTSRMIARSKLAGGHSAGGLEGLS